MTTKSFAEYEREGWTEKAAFYEETSLPATAQAFHPFLDAMGDLHGRELLEIASGTGHLAQLAVERGARVTGIDIAPTMVALAAARAPEATFHVGSGEELPFDDHSFDAVLCCFGLLHMPEPHRAIAEAARVLRPGGRFGFSVWQRPEKGGRWFGMIQDVYRQHADMTVDLPEAPDMSLLADKDVYTRILGEAGFTRIEERQLAIVRPVPDPETAVDGALAGGVRSGMIYKAQTAERQARIREAVLAEIRTYTDAGEAAIPSPALLITADRT